MKSRVSVHLRCKRHLVVIRCILTNWTSCSFGLTGLTEATTTTSFNGTSNTDFFLHFTPKTVTPPLVFISIKMKKQQPDNRLKPGIIEKPNALIKHHTYDPTHTHADCRSFWSRVKNMLRGVRSHTCQRCLALHAVKALVNEAGASSAAALPVVRVSDCD